MNDIEWIENAKKIAPDICDWIGIYYTAEYLGENSEDLVLGPYIGAETEHKRIPLSKGICGLAIREKRTANISDVKSHEEYISCSFETQSELVIPIRDNKGTIIGELDIDSHTKAAFSKEIEKAFEAYCEDFANKVLS